MPEFSYEALATTGQKQHGTLQAGSDREALSMLGSRGLYPVRLVVVKKAAQWSFGKGVRKSVLCAFYSQLADLIHSGVPMLRSMDILERQTSNVTFKEVLRDVRARVADGSGLAQAMAQHPKVFDELAISMVRAGQEAGFLEDVLRRIADFTEHQEDLKSKVVGAMAYPIFLAVVGTIILLGLVVLFVPRFEQIFKRLEEKGELPMLTVVVVGLSHLLLSWYGLFALVALVGLVILFISWSRTDKGHLALDTIRLRLPLAGTIYLNLALSRFTRVLGTMLRNGIPILQALRIAKDSTGNRVLAEAINKSADNIKAGDSLAKPFAASKHFPRDVVEMVSVGEESNSLEKVLIDIANSLEKRTTRQLDLFVRLLEPMMLLVMAVLTLLVVSSLLLPIFKMGSAIN